MKRKTGTCPDFSFGLWYEKLGDAADWEAVLTVTVVGWDDIATIVIQAVRASTWVSSTRPQAAVRRLTVEAAVIKPAAPNDIEWSFLNITISISI